MKIAVYGGTGRIGSRIVAEAGRRGHEATALARHASGSAVVGDAADAASVREVAASHDVVVSAIGPSGTAGAGRELFPEVIRGMASAVGSKRLIVVGGAGSLLAGGTRLVDAPDFPADWKADALLQAAALEILRAERPDLNWTYLSPAPAIEVGERTGKYLSADEEPAGMHISFEDYAVALVDEIESAAHERKRFTVANP